VRLAAAATAERLATVNHAGEFFYASRRNEKPLTLPDRVLAVGLRGPKTLDRGLYIVNTVTGHRSGEPVTFIAAKQELVLGTAVANHQHKMVHDRLDIQNLGDKPLLTANIEKLAVIIPAHINSALFSWQAWRPKQLETRAHAGEMPAQILCGRHILLSFYVGVGKLDADAGERKTVTGRRAKSVALA
jgi:hypothetical protein